MKKEKYYSGTISFWKRVGCAIADGVLFMAITMSIFGVGSVPIIKSCTPYNEYSKKQEENFLACSDLEVKGKLLTYDDDNKEISTDVYFEDLLKLYIDETPLDKNGKYNDIFIHFYTDFNNNELTFFKAKKEYDIKKVNEEIYKINDKDNELFSLNNNDINLPVVFKKDVKQHLDDYRHNIITENSQYFHDQYMIFMGQAWNDAALFLSNSDQFQGFALKYNQYGEKMTSIFSIASLITYTIFFILYYYIVPLLFKKGQTLAKKILHFGLFYEDNTPIKVSTLTVRAIYQYIIYFFLVLFVPVLQIGANIIQMPLFKVGDQIFYLFPLCVMVFAVFVIDGIYMAFNVNKRALHDKMFGLYLKKDSPEFLDEEDDGRPDNVKEQEIMDRGS